MKKKKESGEGRRKVTKRKKVEKRGKVGKEEGKQKQKESGGRRKVKKKESGEGRRKVKTVAKALHGQRFPMPLISFLDVGYSLSFVVRGQRPHRGR